MADELKLPPELRLRSMVVRKLKPLPIEAVVRGYIIGSGWKDYQSTGKVCGIELPPGLQQAQKLPEPIFTPATKAESGHDENISFEEAGKLIGKDLAVRVRDISIRLYREAADYAAGKGIIIADTKFEFGQDAEGRLYLIDEVLTPDSSRFWPRDQYVFGYLCRPVDGHPTTIVNLWKTHGIRALVLLLGYVLRHTAWGRHVYAVGDDKEAARLAGIRVDRVLLSVYTVAGAIYGLTAWILIGRAGAASNLSSLAYQEANVGSVDQARELAAAAVEGAGPASATRWATTARSPTGSWPPGYGARRSTDSPQHSLATLPRRCSTTLVRSTRTASSPRCRKG